MHISNLSFSCSNKWGRNLTCMQRYYLFLLHTRTLRYGVKCNPSLADYLKVASTLGQYPKILPVSHSEEQSWVAIFRKSELKLHSILLLLSQCCSNYKYCFKFSIGIAKHPHNVERTSCDAKPVSKQLCIR